MLPTLFQGMPAEGRLPVLSAYLLPFNRQNTLLDLVEIGRISEHIHQEMCARLRSISVSILTCYCPSYHPQSVETEI